MIQLQFFSRKEFFMGSSIVLVLAFPLMFVGLIFEMIMGAFIGYPTAQIELPYDEATGLVWEYDNVDDPYINLVKTEIKDGKQIFIFESAGISLDWNGEVMELVFTDKNGNEEVYYAYGGAKRTAPEFTAADECDTYELTVTAENPVNGGKWIVTDHNYYLLHKELNEADTQTFTVVVSPENKKGCYANEYGMFSVEFTYVDSLGIPRELSSAIYKLDDGEHYLSETKHQKFSDFMGELLEHAGS